MKKSTRYISLLLAIITLLSIFAIPASAATYSTPAKPTQTTYQVTNVKFVKDVYSTWNRLNLVFAARRDGETALYQESKTVKTTSTLNISVPIKQISAKIGYTVENSISSTVIGSTSAPLKSKESAAFYYRNHWKEYQVTYKVTTTTYTVGGKYTSTTKTETKTIRVAQKLSGNDYGWFYAAKGNASALGKTINEKYCDDKYTCKVK